MCSENMGEGYVLVTFNISHVPLILNAGLCLPKECHMADYEFAQKSINSEINRLYKTAFQNHPDKLNTAYTKEWTQFSLNFHRTDEELSVWQANTETGFFICMGLIGTIVLIFVLIPSAVDFFKRTPYNLRKYMSLDGVQSQAETQSLVS